MEIQKEVGYSYPKTDEQKIYNLEHYNELEESTQAVTSGIMQHYFGVPVSEQSRELIIKHLKGIATEQDKLDLSGMVTRLEVGVDEHNIYLEFMNQVLKINKTVLDRINQIVEIREQDEKNKEVKNKSLNLIENGKINMPKYSYEIDRVKANIMQWHNVNVYAKMGTNSMVTYMFGVGVDLEDVEIRSAVLARINSI